jgi:hypothetical protein
VGEKIRRTALAQERRSSNEATRRSGPTWQQSCPRNQKRYKALNRIDLEFDKKEKNEKAVIEAWKEYLDLLGN